MDAEGPYFLGGELSLIDIAIAPWAVRLWAFDHFKEGGLGEGRRAWARWRKWLAAVESRKSLKDTMSGREYYLPIYQRYADDVAQSELAKATRSGRGVP